MLMMDVRRPVRFYIKQKIFWILIKAVSTSLNLQGDLIYEVKKSLENIRISRISFSSHFITQV